MSTPKQPVINAVLITQLRKIISERWRKSRVLAMSLGPHAHQIYLPAISFFGVTSNQKSTFENLVQSTI